MWRCDLGLNHHLRVNGRCNWCLLLLKSGPNTWFRYQGTIFTFNEIASCYPNRLKFVSVKLLLYLNTLWARMWPRLSIIIHQIRILFKVWMKASKNGLKTESGRSPPPLLYRKAYLSSFRTPSSLSLLLFCNPFHRTTRAIGIAINKHITIISLTN